MEWFTWYLLHWSLASSGEQAMGSGLASAAGRSQGTEHSLGWCHGVLVCWCAGVLVCWCAGVLV